MSTATISKLDPQVDGSSANVVDQDIVDLKELFPDVFSEGKIDFDALRERLGQYIEEHPERYSFSWNGKTRARRIAQTPSTGTLRPCPEESINWDTTKNVFIEGDNLEVLKLLQKSYHKRVKMIYIDPPYNTGKEFIYPDRFQENLDTYLRYTKQVDESGFRLSPNLESSGRYHTNWLNMMYPRLKLARNLLANDGLCFISIDDHEAASLRKLCDEVFGEECFVSQLVWNTEGHCDNQYDVKVNHEYVLVYAKQQGTSLGYVVDPNTREESNLWKGFAENSITKNGSGNPPSEVTLPEGFPVATATLDLAANRPSDEFFQKVEDVGYITRQLTQEHDIAYPIRLQPMQAQNGKLVKKCTVFSGWANADKLRAFISGGCKPITESDGSTLTFYLSENGVIYYRRDRERARNIVSVLRSLGTTEQMRSELERMGIPFQYPKPKQLIAYLISIGADVGGIVLDFFAGSCTTAHAILEKTVTEKASKWRFVMVQLPERLDASKPEHLPGIAFCKSHSLKPNIAEIGKERTRRVIKQLQEGQVSGTNGGQMTLPVAGTSATFLDLGFKVFKLDASNVIPWDADFDNLKDALFNAVENIKPDRSESDVLYELLLKYGLDLATPVQTRTISGKTAFVIGAGALIVCLANNITLDVVEGIAKLKAELKPEVMRVVFKDAGFKDDVVKTNTVQILRQAGIEDVKSI